MTEKLNIEAIRQLLNRSQAQLDDATLACLRKAREQALLRHAPGVHTHWRWAEMRHPAATWFATLLLAICLFGGVTYYWQQTHDNSEIDLAILTDDMPVDVYVN